MEKGTSAHDWPRSEQGAEESLGPGALGLTMVLLACSGDRDIRTGVTATDTGMLDVSCRKCYPEKCVFLLITLIRRNLAPQPDFGQFQPIIGQYSIFYIFLHLYYYCCYYSLVHLLDFGC